MASLDLRRELRRHLRDKPESTFLSVRAEARRWEAEESAEDLAVAQQLTTASNEAELQKLQRQVEDLTKELKALQQPVLKSQKTVTECWYCKKLDHLQKDCRKKRRDMMQSQQGN